MRKVYEAFGKMSEALVSASNADIDATMHALRTVREQEGSANVRRVLNGFIRLAKRAKRARSSDEAAE